MASSIMARSAARRNRKPPLDFDGDGNCPACLGEPTAPPKEAFLVALVICKYRTTEEVYAVLCKECQERFREHEKQALGTPALF
jgi:hypothetical protein